MNRRFPKFTVNKTHADLLQSCGDSLCEQLHEINAMVIDDLMDAGYCVEIGRFAQCKGSYAGKTWAKIHNLDVQINTSTIGKVDDNPWDTLSKLLHYAAREAAEKGI